ncbi:uncharacterized protein LOC106693442 [Microplitis demolitor]|uniref:uncharacterized protein LOC106693442 n=1 Tax=Microplitis demolitor TaxID=69319 RepID=UPI0006D4F067|nr:uncharacterized protein LOC106693442 [Microplitis demolitor]
MEFKSQEAKMSVINFDQIVQGTGVKKVKRHSALLPNSTCVQHKLFEKIYKPLQAQRQARKHKFKVGDKVRISKYKHVFEKGYAPNWSTEIFTIETVQNTNSTTYKLVDYQDKPIEGGFYVEELNKVKHPDVYLIEKIIKKRENKLYVKWLGFDSSHNTWIEKSDL